jgi:hypothetical protein
MDSLAASDFWLIGSFHNRMSIEISYCKSIPKIAGFCKGQTQTLNFNTHLNKDDAKSLTNNVVYAKIVIDIVIFGKLTKSRSETKIKIKQKTTPYEHGRLTKLAYHKASK